jgi:Lon protease-like protein
VDQKFRMQQEGRSTIKHAGPRRRIRLIEHVSFRGNLIFLITSWQEDAREQMAKGTARSRLKAHINLSNKHLKKLNRDRTTMVPMQDACTYVRHACECELERPAGRPLRQVCSSVACAGQIADPFATHLRGWR